MSIADDCAIHVLRHVGFEPIRFWKTRCSQTKAGGSLDGLMAMWSMRREIVKELEAQLEKWKREGRSAR